MRSWFARNWPALVSSMVHGAVLAVLVAPFWDEAPEAQSAPLSVAIEMAPEMPIQVAEQQVEEVATPTPAQPDAVAPVEAQTTDQAPPIEQAELQPVEEVTPPEVVELASEEPPPDEEPVEIAEVSPLDLPVEVEPVTQPPPVKPRPPVAPVVKARPLPTPVAVPAQAPGPSPAPTPTPTPISTSMAVAPAIQPSAPVQQAAAPMPMPVRSPAAEANYYAVLLAWLEKHKEYPRQAQIRRQQGTAILAFELDREGRVLNYRLKSSSGHPALDREVEEMIKRAEPLPRMPAHMADAKLVLEVPVRFTLR
jgi:protein TonB